MDLPQVIMSLGRLRAEIVKNGSADLLNRYDSLTRHLNASNANGFHEYSVRNLLLEKGSAKMLEILDTEIVPALERKPNTLLEVLLSLLTFAGIGYGFFHFVTA